ncbi:TonB family protein [Caulobacter sp.]|uniref:energy transducer TonB n=1 Tax=Caulobacter sp. TaxID=78 RepID=UPI001B136A0A|nr:TonB family protein [Caulobacter sp.]MBO9545758.1 TonB family protein [Caulobacter sp.]
MRGLLLVALAFLTPAAAMADIAPPPGGSTAPAQLVAFVPPPAQIACGQGSARLIEGAAVPPRYWQPYIPPVAATGLTPYAPPPLASSEVYTFSVDTEGHVTDLKRTPSANVTIPWAIDDQTAIIASWRFAPGAAASNCSIDLAPTATPLNQASPARLFETMATAPRSPWPGIRKVLGGDCDSRRRPQMIVYPDLRAFDDKSVDPAWAGLRYDIDANGVVRNVKVAAQHGEAAFADTAASAVAEARYFPGPARTGCFVIFTATPKATPAPARPTGESFERPQDACKITQAQLNLPETKMYPPAFGKRRVAGWAMLRFDVAPWGQVGAVEVLAAQPSEIFGNYARNMLNGARPTAPPTGYRGCVVPIVFAIPAIPEDDY